MLLYQSLVAEEPPTHARYADGEDDGDDESPWFFFHAIDEVHAKHRGDQRWYHHDNGDGGQGTHHSVHVVVDDTLIGVHCRFQNVRVDECGFAGLRHLNVDVLNQVGVYFVNLQFELQFRQQRLVATDRSIKIGKGVL